MNIGTASLSQVGPGAVALKFPGYVKEGDSLTLTFESAGQEFAPDRCHARGSTNRLTPVTFQVTMQALRDGTSYPAAIVLSIP